MTSLFAIGHEILDVVYPLLRRTGVELRDREDVLVGCRVVGRLLAGCRGRSRLRRCSRRRRGRRCGGGLATVVLLVVGIVSLFFGEGKGRKGEGKGREGGGEEKGEDRDVHDGSHE